ncbi:MAG: hypothetical protein GXO42_00100 [bacterium]|nr:hypothetical protein [bacterium]
MRGQAVLEYLVCLVIAGFIYLLLIYPGYLYALYRLFFTASTVTTRVDLQEIVFFDYLRFDLGKIKYVELDIPFIHAVLPKYIYIICYKLGKYCCHPLLKVVFYDKYTRRNFTYYINYPGTLCYKLRVEQLKDEICRHMKLYYKVQVFGNYSAKSLCNYTRVKIIFKPG